MKKLNLVVERSGFVSVPASELKFDMDSVSGNYTWFYNDSKDGSFISSENPTIRWNGIRFKFKFIPSYEYLKKRFFKRYNEILKYPDVKVQIRLNKNTVIISYSTIINDYTIEGKYVIPAKRNETIKIAQENLPYSIKIQIKW